MAIAPVNGRSVAQISQAQKTGSAEMVQNRAEMASARSEDAYTVNISEEARKKAQENARQNSALNETAKPSK